MERRIIKGFQTAVFKGTATGLECWGGDRRTGWEPRVSPAGFWLLLLAGELGGHTDRIDLEGLTSDPQPQPLRRGLPWTDDSGRFIGTREWLVPRATAALEDVGFEELASALCRVTLWPSSGRSGFAARPGHRWLWGKCTGGACPPLSPLQVMEVVVLFSLLIVHKVLFLWFPV